MVWNFKKLRNLRQKKKDTKFTKRKREFPGKINEKEKCLKFYLRKIEKAKNYRINTEKET